MGVCPVPSSYIWKMTIIFDDGRLGFTYGVRYYQDDGRGNLPPNYDRTLRPLQSMIIIVFEDLRGNGRRGQKFLTYVFTNADYDISTPLSSRRSRGRGLILSPPPSGHKAIRKVHSAVGPAQEHYLQQTAQVVDRESSFSGLFLLLHPVPPAFAFSVSVINFFQHDHFVS